MSQSNHPPGVSLPALRIAGDDPNQCPARHQREWPRDRSSSFGGFHKEAAVQRPKEAGPSPAGRSMKRSKLPFLRIDVAEELLDEIVLRTDRCSLLFKPLAV